jgi:hypothetical protein
LVANDIKRFSHTSTVSLERAFSSVGRSFGMGNVIARFCAYSELKHTWRERDGALEFKISDYLEGAPEDVLESLSWYLLSMVSGKRCPEGKADRYLLFIHSKELWESKRDVYLSRARNLSFEAAGRERNLRSVFDYVNSYYFKGKLRDPILAWVEESPRQRLGFYFGPLNLLAANRVLDSSSIPRYVLEYVMYHELLHHNDASNGRSRRRIHHTKSFREQERRFTHYTDAERWLKRIVSRSRTR